MRGLAVDGDATPGCNLHVFAYDPTANIVVLASRGVGQDLDDAVCMGCKENGMQHRRHEAILVSLTTAEQDARVRAIDAHAVLLQKSWQRIGKRFKRLNVHDGHVDEDNVEAAVLAPVS